MCLLVESICLQDGNLLQLHLHQARMDRTRKAIFGETVEPISLQEAIEIPGDYLQGLFKCRVVYDKQIHQVQLMPYKARKISSLKLVNCDQIDYTYKYANRDLINSLVEQRGTCDEIIIVKAGFLTDSSYSNLLFFDGQRWVTPSTPLLKGTQREYLLSQGKITEQSIRPQDLHLYQKARLINAMISFDMELDVPVSQIVL